MPTTPEETRDAQSSLALRVIGTVAILIDERSRFVRGCLPRFDSNASFRLSTAEGMTK
jgi:hypothetical protein